MTRPLICNRDARSLFLDHHLLLRPGKGAGGGRDLDGLLDQLGFVQVDSVNTLARAHDLILWSRRGQYRPKHLERLVAKDRTAFEHWTHDASVIPMPFYPMWRLKFARDKARMQSRWWQDRREGWMAETETVLRHIADHGPASSMDVGEGEAKGSTGWWDWHPSKTALEYLWRSGELAISHRAGFRKFYDLSERVIPAKYLNARMSEAEIVDWAMQAALARLGFATSGELAAFFEIVPKEAARAWCAAALRDGRLLEVDVELADGKRRRSFSTEAVLHGVQDLPEPSSRLRILSPFDPLLRDRARAERLFGFRYRIEIFVPEAKRQYGYYVFPILQGAQMIGRIDAKRAGERLEVRALWPEAGLRFGKGRIAALQAELRRLSALAGCEDVVFGDGWLRPAAVTAA